MLNSYNQCRDYWTENNTKHKLISKKKGKLKVTLRKLAPEAHLSDLYSLSRVAEGNLSLNVGKPIVF